MDKLASCHSMHGFLYVHHSNKSKRNANSPATHSSKNNQRSLSVADRRGILSGPKHEGKGHLASQYPKKHIETYNSSSTTTYEDNSFSSIFHRMIDFKHSHRSFMHSPATTFMEPLNQPRISSEHAYDKKDQGHSPYNNSQSPVSSIYSIFPSDSQTNYHNYNNCGKILLAIDTAKSSRKLKIIIAKAEDLPIFRTFTKTNLYFKIVLIQDHQKVKTVKSGSKSSSPLLTFNESFTFDLVRERPTLSLLIILIQKRVNEEEEREVGHLILGEDNKTGYEDEVGSLSETDDYTQNVYYQNEVSNQSLTPAFEKGYTNCLLSEYQYKKNNGIFNWFKLSNKW